MAVVKAAGLKSGEYLQRERWVSECVPTSQCAGNICHLLYLGDSWWVQSIVRTSRQEHTSCRDKSPMGRLMFLHVTDITVTHPVPFSARLLPPLCSSVSTGGLHARLTDSPSCHDDKPDVSQLSCVFYFYCCGFLRPGLIELWCLKRN